MKILTTPSVHKFFKRMAVGIAVIGCAAVIQAQAEFFGLDEETGSVETVSGDTVAYDLFIPQPDAGRPPPPYPAVILTHGFARDKRYHRSNAVYLAERGIVVLTPNLTSLLGGASDQLRNIANTQGHVSWLISRSRETGDVLEGLIDKRRIGLAGHSAGGAVSFEAALGLQSSVFPASALCLLDAVPWPRTVRTADALEEAPFCSLRSEPSACNNHGSVLKLLERLDFAAADIRIAGATHVDPENPTDLLAALVCGGTSDYRRGVYQRLMYLFFQDAFGMQSVETEHMTYEAALIELVSGGDVHLNRAGAKHPLEVSAPRDGDVWVMGRTYELRWRSAGSEGAVDILASADGRKWLTLAESVADDGSFAIRVAAGPYSSVRLRVVSCSDPSSFADSGVFSVVKAGVTDRAVSRVLKRIRARGSRRNKRVFRR